MHFVMNVCFCLTRHAIFIKLLSIKYVIPDICIFVLCLLQIWNRVFFSYLLSIWSVCVRYENMIFFHISIINDFGVNCELNIIYLQLFFKF